MKKINSGFIMILFLFLVSTLFLSFSKIVFANPVAVGIGSHPLIYVISYVATIIIEFTMFFLLSDYDYRRSNIPLFIFMAFANLITFPIVQIGVIDTYISLFGSQLLSSSSVNLINSIPIFLIQILSLETFALIIEYIIIILVLNSLEDKLEVKFIKSEIFYKILIANIVSFGLSGLITGGINSIILNI